MVMFVTNYEGLNKKKEYSPLPTGEYEMVIGRVSERVTPNDKESLEIRLIVRNDLTNVPELSETNGKYPNRMVFHDNWKQDIEGKYVYSEKGFQQIFNAVGIPEGTPVGTVEDMAELMVGKPVRVFVKKEKNEWNGKVKMVNNVAPWNYDRTKYPNVQHQFKDSQKQESKPVVNDQYQELTEDEVPF